MRKKKSGWANPQFEVHDALLDQPPDDEIDLHGFTVAEAEGHLRTRLPAIRRSRPSAVVHIITGKGRHSQSGAVLLPAVRRLLKGPLAELVADMAPDDGGGGFRVRLR